MWFWFRFFYFVSGVIPCVGTGRSRAHILHRDYLLVCVFDLPANSCVLMTFPCSCWMSGRSYGRSRLPASPDTPRDACIRCLLESGCLLERPLVSAIACMDSTSSFHLWIGNVIQTDQIVHRSALLDYKVRRYVRNSTQIQSCSHNARRIRI